MVCVWWLPRNEYEVALARAMTQLREGFRERPFVGRESIAWGFGTMWKDPFRAMRWDPLISAPLPPGSLVPIIVLNEDLYSYPLQLMRGGIAPIPIGAASRQTPDIQFPTTAVPLHYISIGQPRRSSGAIRLLDRALSVRTPIACGRTGELGTAGVFVRADGSSGRHLLTAGHVFPEGSGSPVLRTRSRFLGRWLSRSLGTVVRQIAPNGNVPGWDAAVIRVDGRIPSGVRVVRNQLRRFDQPESIVAYGAFSGIVGNALVHGGLENFYGWKNCWITGPTGILTDGDSGAAVFTRREEKFLGTYVAQSTIGGTPGMHYVQDAYTLEEEVLKSWGFGF